MIKWYSRTLVCHLLWHPAFWIKSLFLASTLSLPIIGLRCRDQTEYGFGSNPCPRVVTSNRVEYTINKYRMEKIKWVNEREGNSLGDLFEVGKWGKSSWRVDADSDLSQEYEQTLWRKGKKTIQAEGTSTAGCLCVQETVLGRHAPSLLSILF